MNELKKKWLSEEWNGWRYGWIKSWDENEGEYVLSIHEFYQGISEDMRISWTQNITPPDYVGAEDNEWMTRALRSLADDLENSIYFTERELNEYNESLPTSSEVQGKEKADLH